MNYKDIEKEKKSSIYLNKISSHLEKSINELKEILEIMIKTSDFDFVNENIKSCVDYTSDVCDDAYNKLHIAYEDINQVKKLFLSKGINNE